MSGEWLATMKEGKEVNAKDAMIEYQNQESPWLTLAKRIVREDVARKAEMKEGCHEGIQRIEISQTSGT